MQTDGDENETAKKRNILDWLIDCQNQCRADNVGWFIKQFANFVDSAISKQKGSDMVDTAIVDLALTNQQNLEAALRIGESVREIKLSVLRKLLTSVYDGLKEWAKRRQGKDWEVVVVWPGGNWIEKPNTEQLPLLLRRQDWPALVGVAIQAEHLASSGPWGVFIGICGPTQDEWGNPRRKRYGEQKRFVGQESRLRIANAVGSLEPEQGFWVWYKGTLKDSAGRDISNWTDITTVTRLYAERDAVCEHIKGRMEELAAKLECIVIDDT
jgi:hypothetical protein